MTKNEEERASEYEGILKTRLEQYGTEIEHVVRKFAKKPNIATSWLKQMILRAIIETINDEVLFSIHAVNEYSKNAKQREAFYRELFNEGI